MKKLGHELGWSLVPKVTGHNGVGLGLEAGREVWSTDGIVVDQPNDRLCLSALSIDRTIAVEVQSKFWEGPASMSFVSLSRSAECYQKVQLVLGRVQSIDTIQRVQLQRVAFVLTLFNGSVSCLKGQKLLRVVRIHCKNDTSLANGIEESHPTDCVKHREFNCPVWAE